MLSYSGRAFRNEMHLVVNLGPTGPRVKQRPEVMLGKERITVSNPEYCV